MKLRVTQYGEPILKRQGKPIKHFDGDLKRLSEDMLETMYAEEGIGLAAQQIDKAIQICVVDLQLKSEEVEFNLSYDGKNIPIELLMPIVLVNPKLELETDYVSQYEEGCLSFPDIRGNIIRPDALRATFQDVEGAPHRLECNGILSRVIQHEVDHLNGVLFIERMEPQVLNMIESKVKKLRRNTRDYLKSLHKK